MSGPAARPLRGQRLAKTYPLGQFREGRTPACCCICGRGPWRGSCRVRERPRLCGGRIRLPSTIDDSEGLGALDLNPWEAARKKAERARRLNTIDIPVLRVVGFSLLGIGVLLHDVLILRTFSWSGALEFVGVVTAYTLGSWLALYRWYSPDRRVDLGLSFLVADFAVWTFAIYASGGERSWLFFVLITHTASQVNTTFRRVFVLGHLSVLAYALMLVYLSAVEQRPIPWPAEAAKLVFLWGGNIYISLTARGAERRRRKISLAIDVARQLIQRLEDKSEQLEEAKRRAERANRAKSQVLANMSHELRTPLNAIIGFSRVLKNGVYGALNARQEDFVDHISTGGRHLLVLVNDVLDLATIEAGRIGLDRLPFDFADLTREVESVVEELARRKGLALTIDVADDIPKVTGDRSRLGQVMLNLLSNAIKFTPEGGRVTVAVEKIDEETDAGPRSLLHVTVADTGIGIKREDHERVFGAFEQVDTDQVRKNTGTGLGLALARELIALHGGRIWVDSAGLVGQGATFTFVVPIAE